MTGATEQMRALDRRTLIRALVVAAVLLTYYSLDWILLRELWCEVFGTCLTAIGHDLRRVVTAAGPGFSIADRSFSLSRNCTYVDLMLVLAPLVWMPGRALAVNLGCLMGLVATIAALNVFRVVSAIHLNVAAGLDWKYVHFWPDYLLHFGVIIAMAARTQSLDWHQLSTRPEHVVS